MNITLTRAWFPLPPQVTSASKDRGHPNPMISITTPRETVSARALQLEDAASRVTTALKVPVSLRNVLKGITVEWMVRALRSFYKHGGKVSDSFFFFLFLRGGLGGVVGTMNGEFIDACWLCWLCLKRSSEPDEWMVHVTAFKSFYFLHFCLDEISVKTNKQINILYPRCKFNIFRNIGFELPLATGQSR